MQTACPLSFFVQNVKSIIYYKTAINHKFKKPIYLENKIICLLNIFHQEIYVYYLKTCTSEKELNSRKLRI